MKYTRARSLSKVRDSLHEEQEKDETQPREFVNVRRCEAGRTQTETSSAPNKAPPPESRQLGAIPRWTDLYGQKTVKGREIETEEEQRQGEAAGSAVIRQVFLTKCRRQQLEGKHPPCRQDLLGQQATEEWRYYKNDTTNRRQGGRAATFNLATQESQFRVERCSEEKARHGNIEHAAGGACKGHRGPRA